MQKNLWMGKTKVINFMEINYLMQQFAGKFAVMR